MGRTTSQKIYRAAQAKVRLEQQQQYSIDNTVYTVEQRGQARTRPRRKTSGVQSDVSVPYSVHIGNSISIRAGYVTGAILFPRVGQLQFVRASGPLPDKPPARARQLAADRATPLR
eukprot:4754993-Pleurochrysis_carterae.AAC.2